VGELRQVYFIPQLEGPKFTLAMSVGRMDGRTDARPLHYALR